SSPLLTLISSLIVLINCFYFPRLLFLFISITKLCLDLDFSGQKLPYRKKQDDCNFLLLPCHPDGRDESLIYGDIAPNKNRNAVPCTATGCTWPKTGSYVYIPVDISPVYSVAERNIIINGLVSFYTSTCIRFVWKNSRVGTQCSSYLGRQGGLQIVTLQRNGCVYHSMVQHSVNHALGFHHEHVRSDRDSYVRVLTQNIIPGQEQNFVKIPTNNLGTPYDFNSIMHYNKYAFSINGQPTLLSRANPSLNFGTATSMSANDITRINRLYRCCEKNIKLF
uniref:Metalloendopeptidase n=1 Tax=Xiphophorus couchianus TaxID=32473 RepID=A0A3B5KWM5_9TELE